MILEHAVLQVDPSQSARFEAAFDVARTIISRGSRIHQAAALALPGITGAISPAGRVGRGVTHHRLPSVHGIREVARTSPSLLRAVPDGGALFNSVRGLAKRSACCCRRSDNEPGEWCPLGGCPY